MQDDHTANRSPAAAAETDVRSGKRAAIYARVSTDEQVKGTSLSAQVDRCQAAAQAHGWHLAGTFVDEGVSGSLSSRPQLDALVRMVEDEQLDRVVITKLDRIARSLRHLLELLDLLDRKQVTLVALDDPLDPSTASGRAMVHLRGVFAELERQLIRERTAEGQLRRVQAGCWPGGPPPYGYRVVDNPHGSGRILELHPDEAMVVRLAYKLLVDDAFTTGEAAEELRRLGTTPRRAPDWTYHNLRRLLIDGRGLSGMWPWRRAGRGGRRTSEELYVSIPSILDPTEHERLLATLSTTSTQPTSRREYLLRGRLRSPHGTRMQGIPSQGGDRWYRCPHRTSQRPRNAHKCACGRLHASTVEEAVWGHVQELISDPAALELLAAEHESSRSDHAALERDRLAALDTLIASLQQEIADEYAALREEGFDPGAARAAVRKRNEQLLHVRDERDSLLRLRGKNLASMGLAARLRDLAEQARQALLDADNTMRRKVIDIIDLQVEVLRWEPCDTCDGKGLLANPGPRRRGVSPEDDYRRSPILCPDCLRTRQIPVLRISGQVPQLLMSAIAAGDTDAGSMIPNDGVALPFSADVRVA